jgi:hypothetical protein
MPNIFRINRSYRIRHAILRVLFNDWDANGQVERVIGSIIVANRARIPIADVHLWQGPLVEKGEITSSDNDGQIMMSIQLAGRNAFLQQKYIREGQKEKWDGVWDWARIVIPLATLVLSIINYASNRNLNSRLNNLEQKVNQKQK